MYAAAAWEIPEGWFSREACERAVGRLDWTSSPGYPYLLRAPNNGILFKVLDGRPSEDMIEWAWAAVQQRAAGAVPDPIRLFVKPEAHTAKKMAEEKYRLIASVSVIDQIIDHMLFGEMNDRMIANWHLVPSKPGWSIFQGGWRYIPQETWIATDASSWDWTVRPWLLELALELRMSLCKNLNQQWVDLASARYRELYSSPVFITSGGLKLKQKTPGVLKSGCVNTISDNSMMQALLHVRVSLELGIPVEPIFTMGDDRLQAPMEKEHEYFELTSQYCILKSVKHENEFAGFRFRGRLVDPVHKGKHAYNLLHLNPAVLEQTGLSYVLNYHRSNYAKWFEEFFHEMGVELFPRQVRNYIFDGM